MGSVGLLGGKISGLQSKAAAAKRHAKPAAGGDPAKDAQSGSAACGGQVDGGEKPGRKARNNCRKVMQMFGNNPSHPAKVKAAYTCSSRSKAARTTTTTSAMRAESPAKLVYFRRELPPLQDETR